MEAVPNIAYLIVAHDNPAHFGRLVRALSAPNAACFVHIDRKSPIRAFAQTAKGFDVHFCERRVGVYWGEYSQVEATLTLIEDALSDRRPFDYFVLLSGADYPLWSARYISDFLAEHAGTEFMNIVRMPSERAQKPLARLTRYKVPRGAPLAWLQSAVRCGLAHAGLLDGRRDYRRALGKCAPYAGSSWWALTRGACEYALAFARTRTEFVRFFRNTAFPDETFFHTILGNSRFLLRMRHNLTYVDGTGGPRPAQLDYSHLQLFAAARPLRADGVYGRGELLFARKFSDRSASLLDGIDALIAQHSNQALSCAV